MPRTVGSHRIGLPAVALTLGLAMAGGRADGGIGGNLSSSGAVAAGEGLARFADARGMPALFRSALALARFNGETSVRQAALDALRGPDRERREAALYVLMGSRAPEAIEALVGAVVDGRSDGERRAAAFALVEVAAQLSPGQAARARRSAMELLARAEDEPLRRRALELIEAIGMMDEQLEALYLAASYDESDAVRLKAMFLLSLQLCLPLAEIRAAARQGVPPAAVVELAERIDLPRIGTAMSALDPRPSRLAPPR